MNSADSDIWGQISGYVERIEEELKKNLSSRVPLLQDIGNHAILGKGKRLRPLLFVLSSQLCGYQGDDVFRFSTVFEYIHASSLIHDDVLDHAKIRRGRPSVNRLWGNRTAVLAGDFSCSQALCIAIASRNLRFFKTLIEAGTRMVQGQILELHHKDDWEMPRDTYLEIITGKTASLFSAACACGAILSSAEDRAVDLLGQFGLNAGMAFQIIDDLLDYTSFQEELGKPVGTDLREGKITLPLIYTLSRLGETEKKRIQDLFRNGQANEKDYRSLIKLVRENGVIGSIQAEAKTFVDRAAVCLDIFPSSPTKDMLLELNGHIIKRKY